MAEAASFLGTDMNWCFFFSLTWALIRKTAPVHCKDETLFSVLPRVTEPNSDKPCAWVSRDPGSPIPGGLCPPSPLKRSDTLIRNQQSI